LQVGAASLAARKFLGALLIVFCGLIFYLIEPRFYADTANYALHIVLHWQGMITPGRDPLWDFGHVVWKPLGYLLWQITGGAQSSLPNVQAARVLIDVSLLFTFAGALVFFLLVTNYTGKPWAGFLTAIGLVSTHAVLNYAQTGASYIPGTVCQIIALFYFERQLRLARDRATLSWLLPGIFLGLSIIFWFPYSLTVPSVLVFALRYQMVDFRDRVSLILRAAAVCALIVIGVYIFAVISNHITSFAMAHDWYLRSQYGKSQTKGYLRAITGIPRGFFYLGDDGIMWKRLLFQRSSGAHGTALAWLIVQMSWKLVAVYAFLCVVLIGLVRAAEPGGRELLATLLFAAGPILVFAIILFEAGPPERYLPVFPMLFLGAGYLLARQRHLRAWLLGFFAVMLAVNSVALSRALERGRWSTTAAKLEALDQVATPNDVLWVMSYQDDVFRMAEEHPLDPLLLRAPRLRVVAELQSQALASWPETVSKIAVDSWHDGRQVWISKRLLAPQPKLEWNWIEGDDSRVHWREFPAFFSRLQTAGECCGHDGYVRLAQSPENTRILESAAAFQAH
jgi:hypothetical protein